MPDAGRQPLVCLTLVFAVLVPGLTIASAGPTPILNPKHYTSSSGAFALKVDPSDMHGRGAATYRLTKDGQKVWAGERPFTFWDACVTDDGVVCGYAYSHGWRGFAEAGVKAGYGDFRIIILDPTGATRVNRATKRGEGAIPQHGPPAPLGEGTILDQANDRVIFRVLDSYEREGEAWWPFQISHGEPQAIVRPRELMTDPGEARSVRDARLVARTPLILVHWNCSDRQFLGRFGARFTLVGNDGKPVWSLDLPDDYSTAGNPEAEERLRAFQEQGAILRVDEPARFGVRVFKASERVTFAVTRGADRRWTVAEVGRENDTAPRSTAAAVPMLSVKQVGRIELHSPGSGPLPTIRSVRAFVFADRGRIAFLRTIGESQPAFVLVNQTGEEIQTIPLERSGLIWNALAWIGGDRFVLIRDRSEGGEATQGWWLDTTTAQFTPIPGFACPSMSKIAGLGDGGFVVLEGLRISPSGLVGGHGLLAFDARGRRRWALEGHGDSNDPAALFSAEDVAVTSGGSVVVVDVIRKTVQRFDRNGKHQRTIDLERAWGRTPNYPSGISADANDGVVVHDFHGQPPLVRMGADGAVRAQVTPRYSDGQTFRVNAVQVAPDAALWVSDGHSLLRLAASGVVDRVLGTAHDPARLDDAAAVTLDPEGNIYAVVGRTGAVHVFGPDGRWKHACVPAPGDVREELLLPRVTATGTGNVYLKVANFGSGSHVRFSASGKRLGVEKAKWDDISEEWYAQPGGDRWVLGYEKVFLVDETGKTVRTIARRADGHWLEHPSAASVAADGSVAVVSRASGYSEDTPVAVTIYSARGEPIHTFEPPATIKWSFPRIAYDGKLVALAAELEIVLFDATGRARGRFEPEGAKDSWWTPFWAPATGELLLFDGRHTLYRYQRPEAN